MNSPSVADMRIEVVKRELNQGALAGFDSSITDHAAHLVIAALDSFDEQALAAEFRRGFEVGGENQRLLCMYDVPALLEEVGRLKTELITARQEGWQRAIAAFNLRERLGRLSFWHSRETAEGGMVGDFCVDCGQKWPCDTRRMADGTYEDAEGNPS